MYEAKETAISNKHNVIFYNIYWQNLCGIITTAPQTKPNAFLKHIEGK